MTKKGKYKFSSFLVEENLIFYESLNKKKKILAFSLVEFDPCFFSRIFLTLKKCLQERILTYYSIQINIERVEKIILLNFEDNNKDRIIKLFNLILNQLIKITNKIDFLKNEQLENKFLEIIIEDLNSNISVLKKSDSIFISNEKNTRILNFYSINLNYLNVNDSLFHNLINLVNDFNQKGYIIINFRINLDDDIFTSAYLVELKNQDNNSFKFEIEINDFFEYELLEKFNFKLNNILKFLWRNGLHFAEVSQPDMKIVMNEVSNIFLEKNKNQYNFQLLNAFKLQFEQRLMKNKIKFNRINRNLVFLEDVLLFYYSCDLDFKTILKILKKFYNKYFIYFLILNEKNYRELLKIEKINNLDNIKILGPKGFSKINFEEFISILQIKSSNY